MSDSRSISARILLARLNALSADTPPFANYTPSSRNHIEWVGKVQAVVNRAAPSQDTYMQLATSGLYSVVLSSREEAWGKILMTLSRVTTELELQILAQPLASRRLVLALFMTFSKLCLR